MEKKDHEADTGVEEQPCLLGLERRIEMQLKELEDLIKSGSLNSTGLFLVTTCLTSTMADMLDFTRTALHQLAALVMDGVEEDELTDKPEH